MKDRIKMIILEWQELKIQELYQRDYTLAYSEEINTVIGLRRSGKTYFVFTEMRNLIENRGISTSQILYINFEDERLAELKDSEVGLIIDAYFELYPENIHKEVYVFFDEIQSVRNWHLFLKRLYEQKRFKITVTGSSSKLLSSELSTVIRGRTIKLNLFPLNFNEFLRFKKFALQKNIEFSQDRYQVVKYAEEFLKWGGFPRITLVQSETRKKEILKDYLEMIIYKDIVERYSVRNPPLLKMIINYVLTNFASEFSMSAFIKKFQSEYSLNKDTIFSYFSYLEEVGFLYYLPRFSYKIHERYTKKKNYIADNGFIALLSFRGMEIPGRLLENLVFTELCKRGKNLFYYRNLQNHECDFIVTENEQVSEAIQVTYGFSSVNREREIRGLVAALEEFKLPRGIIITNDHEETIRQSSCEINILPFWKWALKG